MWFVCRNIKPNVRKWRSRLMEYILFGNSLRVYWGIHLCMCWECVCGDYGGNALWDALWMFWGMPLGIHFWDLGGSLQHVCELKSYWGWIFNDLWFFTTFWAAWGEQTTTLFIVFLGNLVFNYSPAWMLWRVQPLEHTAHQNRPNDEEGYSQTDYCPDCGHCFVLYFKGSNGTL